MSPSHGVNTIATESAECSMPTCDGSHVRTNPGALDERWTIRAVRWYQRLVEGRPSPCRFFPSCSAYALEALEVHGTRRGLWLTTRRLLRCRPFGPSGFDPVPDPRSRRQEAC